MWRIKLHSYDTSNKESNGLEDSDVDDDEEENEN